MLIINYLESKAIRVNVPSMPPPRMVPSPPPFDNSGIPSSEPEDEGKAPSRGQRKTVTYKVSDFFDDECAVHNKKKVPTTRRTLVLSSNEE